MKNTQHLTDISSSPSRRMVRGRVQNSLRHLFAIGQSASSRRAGIVSGVLYGGAPLFLSLCAPLSLLHAAEAPVKAITLSTSTRQVNYQPAGVAVNAATRRVYVTSRSEDRLLIIDDSNEVSARLPAIGGPRGVAVDQQENIVYVTIGDLNTLLVFNGETNVLTRQVTVGKRPTAVAINPTTKRIYVLNSGDNTLSVIEGRQVQDTIDLGESAQDIAVDSRLNRIYVTCYGSGTVKSIDGNSHAILATTATGQGASGVAVNRTTHRVYVANAESNTLSILDGASNTVLATLPIGEYPQCVAVNPNSNRVYVGSAASHTLTILDGAAGTILSILDAGSSPTALAVNANQNRLYAASSGSNSLLCIKDLPGRLPQGLPILQGPDTPLKGSRDDSVPIVSDVKRAPIDALLTAILGLTARKKFDNAHRMIADAERQYGHSLELAQLEATVLTQEGYPERARLLLQKWIPALITSPGNNNSPTVISITNPVTPVVTNSNGSSLQMGQPIMPNNTPLTIMQPAPGEGSLPERLPISDGSSHTALSAITGPKAYLLLEQNMMESVNKLREQNGLSPVVWVAQLANSARAHSVEMRERKYFGHESPNLSLRSVSERYSAVLGQWDCALGENVMKAGTGQQAVNASFLAQAHQQLSQSPSHRSVLLDPRWTRCGIGIATDEKGGLWITQMFASTSRSALTVP